MVENTVKAVQDYRNSRCMSSEADGTMLHGVVIHAVARSLAQPPSALTARRRGQASNVLARQVAMYLLHCAFGLSLTEAGAACRRDRTTVAHACRRIEDLREDAQFDWLLTCIERAVRAFHDRVSISEAA